jgi:amylosucrase/maltose alpha-D-glucosyltransferase/alpha-amylase
LNIDTNWLNRQAAASLARLLPRLEQRFAAQTEEADWQGYLERVRTHFPRLFRLLYRLYGSQYDFFYHLEQILCTATRAWLERSGELKALDAVREADPHWFQSSRMVGAMCYVDLFAGNLAGLRERIPYLMELGITYLHLMPLFRTPEGDNDGGYAVSSYREVASDLGTMEQLAELAAELRHHGIGLCLDFIFNHTADDHEWARLAMAGDAEHQGYYRMFPDRSQPDDFERTMNPVFPDEHPGAFTYRSKIRRWVWTTFHNYQWDLNYENPAVFNAMAEEMLFLANQGVEVLRLDAVAFVWKRLGTSCENLPEAHWIIQAFNALIRMAAPALVFKSEAIVHPDEVMKYIGVDECQLSYNPMLMALLWDALATRKVALLRHALVKRFSLPEGCAWVNYIRCHDDIGWVFSDDDARELGIDPKAHRRFLVDFYTGRFQGSFARGLPFQENLETGDARVSGTTAALCGLELALEQDDAEERDLAIHRILLLHGVALTIGGIPLLYLGDELGMLNDYSYTKDPEKDGDSRWVHRPFFDWDEAEQRHEPSSPAGQVFHGLLRLIRIRQQNLAFTRSSTEIVDPGNPHVMGYFRHHEEQSVLVLANFSERIQTLEARRLRLLGLRKTVTDILAGRTINAVHELRLEPYQLMILLVVR